VGEAGFISSVRVNGLSRHYELSGDESIPEVVKRAVTHLSGDYLSLDEGKKSPPPGTVGREINYRCGERSVFIR